MGNNKLTNYGKDMSGLLKLAEVLPQTKIKSLECAAAQVFAFVSAPVDTRLLSHCPTHISCSLYGNGIGAEGTSALAAILKETQITNLKCAAARAFAFVSAPVDTVASIPSLANNKLCGVYFDQHGHIQVTYTAEGITVLCEGLKGSSVNSLK